MCLSHVLIHIRLIRIVLSISKIHLKSHNEQQTDDYDVRHVLNKRISELKIENFGPRLHK